jgi:branched-subunit amino acid ABC-type transport system permease component
MLYRAGVKSPEEVLAAGQDRCVVVVVGGSGSLMGTVCTAR